MSSETPAAIVANVAKVAVRVDILRKVASFAVGAVVFGLVTVFGVFHRLGWRQEMHIVRHVECVTKKKEACHGRHHTSCGDEVEKDCSIKFAGFKKTFSKTCYAGTPMPDVDDTFVVYFDPKNKEQTGTIAAFHKFAFCSLTSFLCIAQIAYVIVYMKMNRQIKDL